MTALTMLYRFAEEQKEAKKRLCLLGEYFDCKIVDSKDEELYKAILADNWFTSPGEAKSFYLNEAVSDDQIDTEGKPTPQEIRQKARELNIPHGPRTNTDELLAEVNKKVAEQSGDELDQETDN